MRFCPKCKNYYDDQLLRFCLQDGMPLVDVNQSDQNWSEGTNFVRETNRQIQRKTRQQQFKKILQILIITILVIMVMSVITLQSWIYLSKPETEIIQIASPNPTVKASPTETPETVLSELLTPTPTPKPTPTPTPVTSPTVTVSPTITKTPKPPVCRNMEKLAIQNIIKQEKLSYFSQSIANVKKEEAHAYFLRNYERLQAVRFGVNATNYRFSFRENNCKSLLADFYFEFAPDLPQLPKDIKFPSGTMTFNCTKEGNEWVCK